MKEKKLEQLKKSFNRTLCRLINTVDTKSKDKILTALQIQELADEYTNYLLYEVKIQINNK